MHAKYNINDQKKKKNPMNTKTKLNCINNIKNFIKNHKILIFSRKINARFRNTIHYNILYLSIIYCNFLLDHITKQNEKKLMQRTSLQIFKKKKKKTRTIDYSLPGSNKGGTDVKHAELQTRRNTGYINNTDICPVQ